MEKLGEKGEQFIEKLAELPIDQMLEDVRKALQSLRTILESEDLKGAISGARRAANAVPPTLEDARATLADARKALDTVAGEVRETASAARDTLREAREALDRAEQTLARLEETASGTDEARVAGVQAIEELRQTLRALRNLVDYVQTHPEAVVLGKPSGRRRSDGDPHAARRDRRHGGNGPGPRGVRVAEAHAGGPLLRPALRGRAARGPRPAEPRGPRGRAAGAPSRATWSARSSSRGRGRASCGSTSTCAGPSRSTRASPGPSPRTSTRSCPTTR